MANFWKYLFKDSIIFFCCDGGIILFSFVYSLYVKVFIYLCGQSRDGIFWMSWQDFQIHFRSIYVCRVYPPEMRHSVHGQWHGYSAGGCQDYDTWHQNPQFRMRATGPDASLPIHVFITLTQVLHCIFKQYIFETNYWRLTIFFPHLITHLVVKILRALASREQQLVSGTTSPVMTL